VFTIIIFACHYIYSIICSYVFFFFFSSRRRHTRSKRDWSSDVCSSDLVADYPDPKNKELIKVLSEKLAIDPVHLLLGNGAAELISLLGLYLHKKSILIIQPTFSEYERVCRAHHCQINYYTIQPNQTICLNKFEQAIQDKEAVFLCNPNNPTGKCIKKSLLKKMADICLKHNCLFIIDEAFYDFLIDYDQSIEL